MTRWSDQDIKLDPAIRDWVLIPITIVMLLVGLLRHYAIQLLTSPPKPSPLPVLREQRALARSALLRANGNHLPPARFERRRKDLGEALKEGRYLKDRVDGEEKSKEVAEGKEGGEGKEAQPPNPFENMDGMMDGLKKQAVMMIPQTLIMGWINSVFFGFLCIKLPFPLPNKFKQMLQRGIDTPDLDVSWVSSLSWYFLNLFGLSAVYQLILGGSNEAEGAASMMGGAGMMMGAPGMGGGGGMPGMPGQQPDFAKLFAQEADVNLQLVEHKWVCDGNEGIEDRVLRMHGAF